MTYNNRKYYLHVLEAKPAHPTHAVSIVETDVQVDFAPPMDYVEPVRPATEPIATPQSVAAAIAAGGKKDEKGAAASAAGGAKKEEEKEEPAFHAFAGAGFRLDGKPAPKQPASSSLAIPSSSASSSSSAVASSPSKPSALSSSPVAKPAAVAPAAAKPAPKGGLVFGGAPAPAPAAAAKAPAPAAGASGKGAPASAAASDKKAFVPFSGQGHKLQ